MRLFLKEDRVTYHPVDHLDSWRFPTGSEGRVARNQEEGDLSVALYFDKFPGINFVYAADLVLIPESAE